MDRRVFSKSVVLPVSQAEAFAWHERPGALDRLLPPWESIRIKHRAGGIGPGARVDLTHRLSGLIPMRWLAEHREFAPPTHFRDVQLQGPFAHWDHTHRFEALPDEQCRLEDHIEYALPGGRCGGLFDGLVRRKLEQMFRYRHRVTLADIETHLRHADAGPQQVAITGASGLVGTQLAAFLSTGGHRVTRVVRGKAGSGEVAWDPSARQIDADGLEGHDAVVHLAGESIAEGRWTEAKKERILQSRVAGTRLLCESLARLRKPPRVLISASAIGYYGDRGAEELDESSEPGSNFLADVCQQWEAATKAAVEAGIRVVSMRFGMVLSPQGGALRSLLTPFQLGAGGNVGDGKQYWSWIAIDDVLGAIHHAMFDDQLSGPVNTVAPECPDCQEFTTVLGRVLRRPSFMPLPAFAARLALGPMVDELLLASARVVPAKLQAAGYPFRYRELETALRHLLGRVSLADEGSEQESGKADKPERLVASP